MSDQDRRRWFALAAVALVTITGAVTLAGRAARREQQENPRPRAQPVAIRTESARETAADAAGGAGTAAHERTPDPPGVSPPPAATRRERERRHAPPLAPRQAQQATTAAHAFLTAWLPYSYGREDARRLRAAAAPLRRELRAAPPRVPATVASGRPRVISVRAQAATSSERVHVLALVADGRRRYAVSLEVERFASGWLVTAVGG